MTLLFSFEIIGRNGNFSQIKTCPNQAIKQACVLETFGTFDKTCKNVCYFVILWKGKIGVVASLFKIKGDPN